MFRVLEEVFGELFNEFAPGRETTSPFPRITYRDALVRYGTDKPDLRAKLELVDVSHLFQDSEFRAFAGKHVRALPVPGCTGKPRSFFDQLGAFAIERGAQGLAWVRLDEGGKLSGPIAKFLTENVTRQLIAEVKAEPGAAVFFGAGDEAEVAKVMSEVRVEAAKRAELFDHNAFYPEASLASAWASTRVPVAMSSGEEYSSGR